MHIYIYVCVYTYVCIYTYACTYIHTFASIYIWYLSLSLSLCFSISLSHTLSLTHTHTTHTRPPTHAHLPTHPYTPVKIPKCYCIDTGKTLHSKSYILPYSVYVVIFQDFYKHVYVHLDPTLLILCSWQVHMYMFVKIPRYYFAHTCIWDLAVQMRYQLDPAL